MSQRFFRKAIHAPWAPKPPKVYEFRALTALGTRYKPDGGPQYRLMDMGKAQQAMGGRRGGKQAWLNGRANKFNSISGRKAARRRWDRYSPINGHIGVRLGLRANRRPAVNHASLRVFYTAHPTYGVWFDWEDQRWYAGVDAHPISERTALTRLGHLKPQKGRERSFIPDTIKPMVSGKQLAGCKGRRRLVKPSGGQV